MNPVSEGTRVKFTFEATTADNGSQEHQDHYKGLSGKLGTVIEVETLQGVAFPVELLIDGEEETILANFNELEVVDG